MMHRLLTLVAYSSLVVGPYKTMWSRKILAQNLVLIKASDYILLSLIARRKYSIAPAAA